MKRTVLISAEVEVQAPDGISGRDVVSSVLQSVVGWAVSSAQMQPLRVRVDHGPSSMVCAFTDPNAPGGRSGGVVAGPAG